MTEALSKIVLDAYAQALLAAKTKGLTGEPAKSAAFSAVARVVTRTMGHPISPAEVQAIVSAHF